METILIKEQYKVIRVIHLEEHFAALHAVDVTSRSNEQYILNVYTGDLLKKYVGCFTELHSCPDYAGMFVRDESLVAVFRYDSGKPIDTCFFMGDRFDTLEAVKYADRLFKAALSVSDFPPEISCAMLQSANVMLRPTEERAVLRPVIFPTEEMNGRELVLLLTDHLKKILHVRFSTGSSVRKYLRTLEETPYTSVVRMYSAWCELRPAMEEEEKGLRALSFIPRMIGLIAINLKSFFSNLFRKQKEVRL